MGFHDKEIQLAPVGDIPAGSVRVWDIAVRLFHWSMVLAFGFAYISADLWGKLHEYSGYVIMGLIGFRIIWGLIGTTHARFTNFIFKPATVIAYIRDIRAGTAKRYIGHNPAGGAMVVALLVALATITATGFAMTTNAYWGVEWVEDLHEFAANGTVLLIALHVGGVILASLQHKENLVKAMITGKKPHLSR